MKQEIFDAINSINVLSEQVSAVLDLIMISDSDYVPQSVRTAAEMGLTIHDEMMHEIEKLRVEVVNASK